MYASNPALLFVILSHWPTAAGNLSQRLALTAIVVNNTSTNKKTIIFFLFFDSESISVIAGSEGTRRSIHSELLMKSSLLPSNLSAKKPTTFTVSCCCVQNYLLHVQLEIRLRLLMAWWEKTEYWLTSLLRKSKIAWLHDEQTHQLLFCCISDKVAAQRCPQNSGTCSIKPPPETTGVNKSTSTELSKIITLKRCKVETVHCDSLRKKHCWYMFWLASQAKIKTCLKFSGSLPLGTCRNALNFWEEFQAKRTEWHDVRLNEVRPYKSYLMMPSEFDCHHLVGAIITLKACLPVKHRNLLK